eukprot:6469742-Alexandrium_andersonii.AAC.1
MVRHSESPSRRRADQAAASASHDPTGSRTLETAQPAETARRLAEAGGPWPSMASVGDPLSAEAAVSKAPGGAPTSVGAGQASG